MSGDPGVGAPCAGASRAEARERADLPSCPRAPSQPKPPPQVTSITAEEQEERSGEHTRLSGRPSRSPLSVSARLTPGVRGPGALHRPHLAHVPLSPRPARSGDLPSPRGPEVRTRLVLPTGSRSWFRRHLQHWPRCPEGAQVSRTPQGCSASRTPMCQRSAGDLGHPDSRKPLRFALSEPASQRPGRFMCIEQSLAFSLMSCLSAAPWPLQQSPSRSCAWKNRPCAYFPAWPQTQGWAPGKVTALG